MEIISRYLRFASKLFVETKNIIQRNHFLNIKQIKRNTYQKQNHLATRDTNSSIIHSIKDAPMGSIWSFSPLKPRRVRERSIHRVGMWSFPGTTPLTWTNFFHLGSLPNSESSAPGRRLQALLRQDWGTRETWIPPEGFFLVGLNVPTSFFFFSEWVGLCVGFIHLSVCFWFGWDKMKVQQYIYMYM